MTAIEKLIEKRNAAMNSAKALRDKAEGENRSLTDEERKAFDGFLAEHRQIGEDIERQSKLDAMEREAQESAGRRSGNLPHNDPSNTKEGKHRYSVLKALRESLAQREGTGRLTGVELETHIELAKRKDPTSPVRGVLIPWDDVNDAPSESRALDTTTGATSIPTILGSLICLLRARLAVVSMGATVMNGMQGLFSLPRQNAAATAYWLAEGGAPTGSNQTTDQVAFTPKTVGAYTDYTRRFVEQTNLDAEAFVKADLAAIIARAIETAAVNGSGTLNQPKGILQVSGISTVAIGTNGGAPTWDSVVGLESQVAISNADMGNLGYLTDAAVRGKLKRTAKIGSTFPIYLWDTNAGDTPLNGYKVGITNLLPSNLTKGTGSNLHSMIYGNWADLMIAFWSGLDVLVDPYSNSTSGTVRVVALQDCDVEIRHNESFAKILDIDVS